MSSSLQIVSQSGVVPMRASKIVENYRRSGYTLPDCKNEQDDNSIDAIVKDHPLIIGLRLLHSPDDTQFQLNAWEHYDNAQGMTRTQIIDHLEIGGAPHGDTRLHGMAHTGGKTSCWNIGHDMIVASKVVGGRVHCIKMSTRPLEIGVEELRWEEVSYEREISEETRKIFDAFPSGTIVCVKDILEKNKIDVRRLALTLEEGTRIAYNRVPVGTKFILQVQTNDPVEVRLRDSFYETEENAVHLDNHIDATLSVYEKHGTPYVMLKSTSPIYKGKAGIVDHTTRGTPDRPVYYNITRTLQAREGRSGKPIEWVEEMELMDYVFRGDISTRAINIKMGHEDGQKSGYHIQRNDRLLGYDKFTDVKSGDSYRFRMRLRVNFSAALDSLFGVQFNKKNTTGIQNPFIKAAIDDYWRTITTPWINENKRRAQDARASAAPVNPRQFTVVPVSGAGVMVSLPASPSTSEAESGEGTDDDDTISIPPPLNPNIAWIREHETELRTPEVLAELCRLLNLRPIQ